MEASESKDEAIHGLFNRALGAVLKGKGATATRFLQQALKVLESSGTKLDENFHLSMLFPWADLFWSINRPDLVLKVFDAIEKESPGDPQISLHRAIALFHLARFEEAQNLLSDLEDRGYPAADLHFFLGCLAERVSREATAMAHFTRAATLEPERYVVPAKRDEQTVRDVMNKLIGGVSGPLRNSLSHARLVIEPLPTDKDLRESQPPVDPLALASIDAEEPGAGDKAPQIHAIRLFMKNIEKTVINNEELEERLTESLTHELSSVLHSDEDEIRKILPPPTVAAANQQASPARASAKDTAGRH